VRFNQGPHAVYRGGEGWRVLARLGIEPTGAPPALAGARLLSGERLVPMPRNALGIARTPLLRARGRVQVARLFAALPKLRATDVAGRTAAEWFGDLDLTDDARQLVAMLTRVSTYSADLERLPAEVAVGQLQMSTAHGVLYLDGGWNQLVDALVERVGAGGAVMVDHDPATEVRPTAGGWMVRTGSGRSFAAPTVVLAAGGPAANGALLPEVPSAWRDPGPDVTAACLDLAVSRAPDPPVVFGLDEPLYLSTHCPPARLAPEGISVVAVARYRASGEPGDAQIDRAQLAALAARAGIDETSTVRARYLHRMVVVHAMPSASSGLAGRSPVAVDGADGLFVAGDWVGPLGWLADASMASGEAAGLLAASAARPVLAR
jgi:phytoene dehydrogenase-like protein